ncbi:class I SAM-dependent methyltransferase [Streptomyces sp. M10(2022)]
MAKVRVLDIGCSYGINAALLKYDTTMDELYAHYDSGVPESRAQLLARDRDPARSRGPAHGLRFTGLDASTNALDYAREAGLLDDAVHADLEAHDPTPQQRAQLAGTDLVISTGCIGYVTERTLTRVVGAQGERRPWMAHFVLRMFPFGPVEDALAGLGYRTTRADGCSDSAGSRTRRKGHVCWTACRRQEWMRAVWRRRVGSTHSFTSPGRATRERPPQ